MALSRNGRKAVGVLDGVLSVGAASFFLVARELDDVRWLGLGFALAFRSSCRRRTRSFACAAFDVDRGDVGLGSWRAAASVRVDRALAKESRARILCG